METYVNPTFTGEPYDPAKTVRIRDRWQQYLYIKNGAVPLDIYVSTDEDLIMVFDKEKTSKLYEKYRKYQLK